MDSIVVDKLTKCYKLYDRPVDRIKDWVTPADRRYHREYHALQDVSFSVEKGKALGIVGPNGAGKSTLLKILTGTTTATSGAFTLTGRVAALLELGAGFHPEFSGRDNIVMNAKLLGLSDDEIADKLDEIIEFSELEDFIELPVRTYSSGMYVRLGFSIACGINPDILIIDEALAVGDAYFSQKSINRIENFLERGVTILFVSHDMRTLQRFCDNALWLNEGHAQSYGDAKNVVIAYEAYTKEKEYEYKKQRDRKRANSAPHKKKSSIAKKDYKVIGDTWGTGEALITGVRMLDESGREKWTFERNEKATLRIFYYAFDAIDEPIFGINIHRIDGTYVMGSNNWLINPMSVGRIEKEGYVDFEVDLMLHRGSYFWSVMLALEPDEPYWSEPADFHYQTHEFRITSDMVAHGVIDLPSRWIAGREKLGGSQHGVPSEIDVADGTHRRFMHKGWELTDRRKGIDFCFSRAEGRFLMFVPEDASRLLMASFFSERDLAGMNARYVLKADGEACDFVGEREGGELEFEIPGRIRGAIRDFVLTVDEPQQKRKEDDWAIGVNRIWFE